LFQWRLAPTLLFGGFQFENSPMSDPCFLAGAVWSQQKRQYDTWFWNGWHFTPVRDDAVFMDPGDAAVAREVALIEAQRVGVEAIHIQAVAKRKSP
jgi:hypothetical protein